eukprot:scaffold165336_cov30-Prasinocladus_malaysianus.AAC.1
MCLDCVQTNNSGSKKTSQGVNSWMGKDYGGLRSWHYILLDQVRLLNSRSQKSQTSGGLNVRVEPKSIDGSLLLNEQTIDCLLSGLHIYVHMYVARGMHAVPFAYVVDFGRLLAEPLTHPSCVCLPT